ncbi:amidohydrolase [Altericroceibacterium endophyticum]|uniref:Amidohydrolase family protein n=1 Tax=Altericroceibacterium endophyticum TaxID=1808508 RepID=A0A6I4TA27_9SPHN|nr:amidohydrolase [Altericroceibacterium endophyticum]MXO66730.1 amidohydrolase family protein [Altericroceibacterium endophyticum]
MRAAILSTIALAAFSAPAAAQFNEPNEYPPVEADLVIEDARIYTPDGWASTMAVADGVIVAVGDAEDVAPHMAASTQTLDLNGRMVMPGLHDMHVHPMGAGMAQKDCRVPQGSALDAALAVISECAAKAEAGHWITGGGYDNNSLGVAPTRQLLDEVSPDNPIILRDISGHSAWANSRALAIAEIDANTPDPAGGIIERDSSGEPTGVLREAAAMLVSVRIPEATVEEASEALSWAVNEMMSYGITAFDDAGVAETSARAYDLLADTGRLPIRARGCLWGRDMSLIDRHMEFARDNFSPTCVKLMLDGVPTDGHTAAMVDPYVDSGHSDHDQTARERGLLMIPPAEVNALVADLDRRGFTVKFHAAGDAAVRAGLDAIEYARQQNGFSGQYHNVGHNSFVQMSDIERARGIFATFEFSPYIWYPNPIIGDIRRAVGEERMKRWIPVKDAIDAGALVVPGSDWSVVPSVNPWLAIETLVTRQVPGGGGEVLGAQERITLKQAVDMFTRNSAQQMNFGHATGTIEEGKLADIIVLDRNIFEVPITSVHDTKVLMSMVGGEVVYQAD